TSSPPASTTRPARLPSLTGMRAVAAAGVFLGHAHPTPLFIPLSMAFLSFFFVLSGFVLAWSADPADTPRSFWRRRFWKIAPNHVATWASMLVLLAVLGISGSPGFVEPGLPDVLPALANLLLLHTLLPLREFMFGVNPPTWSLASEFVFYLLFPLILPLVLRLRPKRLPLAALAMVAATLAVPFIALTLTGPVVVPGAFEEPLVRFWFAYYFPLARLPEFVLGIVLALMVRNGFLPRLGVVAPLIALVACVGVGTLLPMAFTFAAVTIVPVAMLVVGAASMDVRGVRSVWQRPGVLLVGQISFAFYLTHYQVILLFDYFVGDQVRGAIGPVGTLLVLMVLCTAAAWLLYRFFEQPLVERFGTRRRSRGAAGPRPREVPSG
ncbi:acyltransferase family protein, partial [Marinitenerispora sediminis]